MKKPLLALLLAAALAPTGAMALPLHGQTVAPIKLPTAAGSIISTAALQGKPVYLNFFATWCPPCNDEASTLEAIDKQYAKDHLAVVGIDVGDSQAEVQQFAQKYGLTYPIALDASGDVADELGVDATPTNVFIDKSGHVSAVVVGEMTPAEIDAALNKLM